MALVDLWKSDRTQLRDKRLRQVISFAGQGRLEDGSGASEELRDYLSIIPSELLATYTDECISEPFTDSGLALQDVVNEIGRRIGFSVLAGRYRGTASEPGHDGIWSDENGHSIVVEVKTTDAYRISLDTMARYRQELAKREAISAEFSSILIVVGREDTGELEAQIRGSHHAWDVRLISVDALLRALRLTEELDDPRIVTQIHALLVPREFTRLDQIVEIALAAVEDVRQDTEGTGDEETRDGEKKFTPVAFHAECVDRLEKELGVILVKHSRASFSSADGEVRLLCTVSRYHERNRRYWFAFHPYQDEFLAQGKRHFIAFGCGDPGNLFLIPYDKFKPWLEFFNKTTREDQFYWHVQIGESEGAFAIMGRAGTKNVDITKYRLD